MSEFPRVVHRRSRVDSLAGLLLYLLLLVPMFLAGFLLAVLIGLAAMTLGLPEERLAILAPAVSILATLVFFGMGMDEYAARNYLELRLWPDRLEKVGWFGTQLLEFGSLRSMALLAESVEVRPARGRRLLVRDPEAVGELARVLSLYASPHLSERYLSTLEGGGVLEVGRGIVLTPTGVRRRRDAEEVPWTRIEALEVDRKGMALHPDRGKPIRISHASMCAAALVPVIDAWIQRARSAAGA